MNAHIAFATTVVVFARGNEAAPPPKSSPAASLAPKASVRHDQTTYHFVGEQSVLEPIARRMLGVSLADVNQ